jgi:hypothetical protein
MFISALSDGAVVVTPQRRHVPGLSASGQTGCRAVPALPAATR